MWKPILTISALILLNCQVEGRPSLQEAVIAPAPAPAPKPAPEPSPVAVPASNAADSAQDSGSDESGPSASEQCCPDGWKEYQNHCYKGFTKTPLPFYDVSKQCRRFGAHFVSVHSRAEYAFVKSNWDLNKFWIGVVSYQDGHHENEDGTDNNFQEFDDPVWDASEAHPYICETNHCIRPEDDDSE